MYSKEETIKDMKRCIEQFRKNKLYILADMKQKELNKILEEGGK